MLDLKGIDLWRLCEVLSVQNAALLIAGVDPGTTSEFVEEWEQHNRPAGYEAAKAAICAGLQSHAIEGKIVPHYTQVSPAGHPLDAWEDAAVPDSVNIFQSTVKVESLRTWLRSRGLNGGFFFPPGADEPDFLNKDHRCYAPKLAAAVKAWRAVVDEGLFEDQGTPKQHLDKWLREHAAEFGLTRPDGKQNETAIGEISKIANWKPEGGAAKTPAAKNPTIPLANEKSKGKA